MDNDPNTQVRQAGPSDAPSLDPAHYGRSSFLDAILERTGFVAALLAACGLTIFLIVRKSSMPASQAALLLFLAWIAFICLGLLQDVLQQERRIRRCQRWRKFGGGEAVAWHLDLYFYSAVLMSAAALFCWMAVAKFGDASQSDADAGGKPAASQQMLQLKVTQSTGLAARTGGTGTGGTAPADAADQTGQ
jgi:hypothetical protein